MQNRTAKAILRKVRVSPQKLNIVAAMIRGLNAQRACDVLQHSKRRIANDVRKTVLSAIANAENNAGINSDSLFVKEAYVGYSLKLRRFHPRGRGRGGVVTKPFSHLTVVLEERN
ncbi:MAG: 50S ribosomal protein L22 [Alphaproteobacteria bacterium]|nr:50S ribosomal protein L22 [Alphaproteobacteria bacterium]